MTKQTLPDTIEIDGVKYQKVEEPKESKTLEQMLDDVKYFPDRCDTMCDIVERWMSQFHPHDASFGNLTYCNGFFDAIEALRSNLRQNNC